MTDPYLTDKIKAAEPEPANCPTCGKQMQPTLCGDICVLCRSTKPADDISTDRVAENEKLRHESVESEPRVFWAVYEDYVEDESYASGAFCTEPGGNIYWEDNQFPLVEKSAYDKLKVDHDKMQAALHLASANRARAEGERDEWKNRSDYAAELHNSQLYMMNQLRAEQLAHLQLIDGQARELAEAKAKLHQLREAWGPAGLKHFGDLIAEREAYRIQAEALARELSEVRRGTKCKHAHVFLDQFGDWVCNECRENLSKALKEKQECNCDPCLGESCKICVPPKSSGADPSEADEIWGKDV